MWPPLIGVHKKDAPGVEDEAVSVMIGVAQVIVAGDVFKVSCGVCHNVNRQRTNSSLSTGI